MDVTRLMEAWLLTELELNEVIGFNLEMEPSLTCHH